MFISMIPNEKICTNGNAHVSITAKKACVVHTLASVYNNYTYHASSSDAYVHVHYAANAAFFLKVVRV